MESSSNFAGLIAIYAALAYDIVAATNSSPQTTEINAGARSETLMKWVYIGLSQVVLLALIGAALQKAQKQPVWPPLVGSAIGGGLMWVQYVYARNCGLQNPGAPTEQYGR